MLDPIAAVTAPDPYPYYRALVAERPVHRDEKLGLWVVASAAAVEAILAQPAACVRPPSEPVPQPLVGSTAGAVFGAFARMTEGPAQVAIKHAIRAALASVTAARVAAEARAWLSARLADDEPVCAGTINEIAFALPVSVVAALLGVAPAVRADVTALIAAFAAGIAPSATVERAADASKAADRLLAILRAALGLPEESVLHRLRAAAPEAPSAAVLANALGLLFQTCDATAGLVGNTLLAASRHRDAYVRVANRARLADFVDEVQRHDPPVHNTRRFLAQDLKFAGQSLRKDDAILVVLAAANHDPAANAGPERFDVDRADRRSFTFGAGRHACPGTMIATAIAAAAAEILVPRLVDLDRLAESIGYRPLPNARIPVFGRNNDTKGGLA
jgi:cytochrome P450